MQLLEQTSLFIHLDPRASGVMVPQWFRKQPHLVLQVGLNMAVPIHDLRVEEEGISCTLSFNRSPFFCVMPWDAIFALSGDDGRGVIWPDEVPGEVAPQFGVAGKPAAAPAPAKAPHLRAVQSASPEATPAAKTKAPKRKPKAKETPEKTAAKASAPRPRKPSKKGAALADAPIRSAPTPSPAPEATAPEAQPLVDASKALPLGGSPRRRELPPYLRVVK